MKNIKWSTILFLFLLAMNIHAQSKNKLKPKSKTYPETFTINKSDFEKLMNESLNKVLKFPSNSYLDKSIIQLNTKSGDMHFVKLKLSFFTNSYLMVQENGIYSTIIFIMSDDKSVFYKGKLDKDFVSLKKCSEDDIVSE